MGTYCIISFIYKGRLYYYSVKGEQFVINNKEEEKIIIKLNLFDLYIKLMNYYLDVNNNINEKFKNKLDYSPDNLDFLTEKEKKFCKYYMKKTGTIICVLFDKYNYQYLCSEEYIAKYVYKLKRKDFICDMYVLNFDDIEATKQYYNEYHSNNIEYGFGIVMNGIYYINYSNLELSYIINNQSKIKDNIKMTYYKLVRRLNKNKKIRVDTSNMICMLPEYLYVKLDYISIINLDNNTFSYSKFNFDKNDNQIITHSFEQIITDYNKMCDSVNFLGDIFPYEIILLINSHINLYMNNYKYRLSYIFN